MRFSPLIFRKCGAEIGGYGNCGSQVARRRHQSLFGINPLKCSILWDMAIIPEGARPKHLLWALLFARTYLPEETLASMCRVQEKTFRKWVWLMVSAIGAISSLIRWEHRLIGGGRHNRCRVSVDGTDFRIREPKPFWPGWFSHKFSGPGVRYEVGVAIQNGWIVWVNGPFPCGDFPDLRIVRESLIYELEEDEYYIADGGYGDGGNYSMTPTGRHDFSDRQMATVRARHETINARFKNWKALQNTWRHRLDKHGILFRMVANIVQLGLQTDSPAFSVQYDEMDFDE